MSTKKAPENIKFFLPAEFCELRMKSDGDKNTLEGYAAVFDQWTQIGSEKWGFREVVRSGAFKKTIKEADIRGLKNHDPNLILSRNTAGTLRLSEDARGLHYEMDLGKQSYAVDLRESIERNEITGNSFSFRTIKDSWNDDKGERELLECHLYDVGPVTFPAYEQTSLSLRSLEESGIDIDALSGILARYERGRKLNEEDTMTVNRSIEILSGILPHDEPGGETIAVHSVPVDVLIRKINTRKRKYSRSL
jgi:HK97 family phage prohead protease